MSAFGSGIEMIRTSQTGAVNHGAILEQKGVDLEQYFKQPVESGEDQFLRQLRLAAVSGSISLEVGTKRPT